MRQKRKGITIDVRAISEKLEVPVVAAAARSGEGLAELMQAVDAVADGRWNQKPLKTEYDFYLEKALKSLEPAMNQKVSDKFPVRWSALMLLESVCPVDGNGAAAGNRAQGRSGCESDC